MSEATETKPVWLDELFLKISDIQKSLELMSSVIVTTENQTKEIFQLSRDVYTLAVQRNQTEIMHTTGSSTSNPEGDITLKNTNDNSQKTIQKGKTTTLTSIRKALRDFLMKDFLEENGVERAKRVIYINRLNEEFGVKEFTDRVKNSGCKADNDEGWLEKYCEKFVAEIKNNESAKSALILKLKNIGLLS